MIKMQKSNVIHKFRQNSVIICSGIKKKKEINWGTDQTVC